MTVQTILPIDRDAVQSLSTGNNEPAWMTELRLEALQLAAQLELPKLEKTRLDRWNIESYGKYIKSGSIASLSELPPDILELIETEGAGSNLLVQRNSGAVYCSVSAELTAKGVIFTDLETAVRDHSDLVRPYFMSAVKKEEHRLTALHAAMWTGGVFLYVPKNVKVDVPIQALFLSDDANASFAPHILIVAEANSQVTYVDNYASGSNDDELVHNGVAEVFVKPGAHVRYASVHNLGAKTTDLSFRRAIVENDGAMEWIIGEMNNGNCASDTSSVLRGNGSSSDAKVICVGTDEQKLNITTRAVHFGKNSSSDMTTRAVMRDEATAIINGITKIEKGATNAHGEQTEKVMMLSPRARGDANPMLLIDEDEVKAGHAASVGQVNPEQVHYLMSRGISKAQATRLIIYGFLAPVVAKIPIEKLENRLQALVERKLGQ
jgi:Fe-S cluster assembly protein SufD